MLLAVVNQLFIDFVGDDVEALLHRQLRDARQLLAVPDAAVRIVRRVENQRLGALGDVGREILRLGDEALLHVALHQHRHAADDAHDFRIGNPARRRDDDLVSGVHNRGQRGVDGEFRAVGDDHLRGRILQSVVPAQLFADCAAQAERAGRRRILGQPHIQRLVRGGADILRGDEIRLTDAEGHHVAPAPAHFLRLCVDRQRGRRRNRRAHTRKLQGQDKRPLKPGQPTSLPPEMNFKNIIHPFYPFCNRHFAFICRCSSSTLHISIFIPANLSLSVIFPRFLQLMRRAAFLLKTLAIIFFLMYHCFGWYLFETFLEVLFCIACTNVPSRLPPSA